MAVGFRWQYMINYAFAFYRTLEEHNTHVSEHCPGKLYVNLTLLLSIGMVNTRLIVSL